MYHLDKQNLYLQVYFLIVIFSRFYSGILYVGEAVNIRGKFNISVEKKISNTIVSDRVKMRKCFGIVALFLLILLGKLH
jgi:hypothetical protein